MFIFRCSVSKWLLALLMILLLFSCQGKSPKDWVIEGALAAFDDPNLEVKLRALDKLRVLGAVDRVAIGRIVIMLEMQDVNARSTAVRAFNSMGEAAGEQAPRIAKLLKDRDGYVRSAAVRVLGGMGEAGRKHAPEIAQRLKDRDSDVRSAAVRALDNMGETANYAPQIAGLLKDRDGGVRSAAVRALGNMGEAASRYAPQIVALLKDRDDVRFAAVRALGEMDQAASKQAPKIVELLKNPDRDVRSAAVQALGSMDTVASKYALQIAGRLKDRDKYVRSAAVRALDGMGEAGNKYALWIVALLKDRDGGVRAAAVRALGSMDEKSIRYIPNIVGMMKDSDSNVRSAAVKALGNLGAVARIVESLKDPDKYVRSAAVTTLVMMGDVAGEQVPEIVEMLRDPDKDVRSVVALGLFIMGDAAREQAPRIVELLGDPDGGVRAAAVEALSMMGDAAKEQVPRIAGLLRDPDGDVRSVAVKVLGGMEEAAREHVPEIVALLKDRDADVRSAAVEVLGNMGRAVREHIPEIVSLIKDQDYDVRFAAFRALEKMAPLDIRSIAVILSPVYDNALLIDEHRFHAHVIGGGRREEKIFIRWLGLPSRYPENIARYEGVHALKVFKKAWEPSMSLQWLRDDLARQTAVVAFKVKWEYSDFPLLQAHRRNLQSVGSPHVAAVEDAMHLIKWNWRVFYIGRIIVIALLLHLASWCLLMRFYPEHRWIQSIFFWTPWVRRIAGLGYISPLLLYIRYLRSLLFAPFRELLLSDAALGGFDSQMYFEDSEVREVRVTGSGQLQTVRGAIPEIRGQIVLVGDSGLGKTMFLRDLVRVSRRNVVYLPAARCSEGVTEAIHAKLSGLIKSPGFLRKLVYKGAMDICVDGMSEVTAETCARVIDFADNHFQGNIIMTTRPLEWTPPEKSMIYVIQPLTRGSAERFLLTREHDLLEDAIVSGEDYRQACLDYLNMALDGEQPPEILIPVQRTLSNPMDLTVAAEMLATGKEPDLSFLQQQQYAEMANAYRSVNMGQDFPLGSFSEEIYQMRLSGKTVLPSEEYLKEMQFMERHRMAVSQQYEDTQGETRREWYFRHDKIMEFFIAQTFLGVNNNRSKEHLGDPRFGGVYLLLAMLMPLEDAEALREDLIHYAADTRDHTVSDTFVQIVRSRRLTL